MATKDITDLQVVQAQLEWNENKDGPYCYEILMNKTGESLKVCMSAMDRAVKNGFLDYGVSLRTAWVTDKGEELLK